MEGSPVVYGWEDCDCIDPSNPEVKGQSEGRQGDRETRGQGDKGTGRQGEGGQGDWQTRRQGDKERGDKETGGQGEGGQGDSSRVATFDLRITINDVRSMM